MYYRTPHKRLLSLNCLYWTEGRPGNVSLVPIIQCYQHHQSPGPQASVAPDSVPLPASAHAAAQETLRLIKDTVEEVHGKVPDLKNKNKQKKKQCHHVLLHQYLAERGYVH